MVQTEAVDELLAGDQHMTMCAESSRLPWRALMGFPGGDNVTNVLDLISLLLCFAQPAVPGCEAQDVNGDGQVNVLDLIELLLAFGTTCP